MTPEPDVRQRLFEASRWILMSAIVGICAAAITMVGAVSPRTNRLPDSDELYLLRCRAGESSTAANCSIPVAMAVRDGVNAIDELAFSRYGPTQLTRNGRQRAVGVRRVSSSFFSTLGVRPVVGRWFVAADNGSPARPVVLAHDAGHEIGGGSSLGRTVTLDGLDYVVVGVMPEEFSERNAPTWAWTLDHLTVGMMEGVGFHDAEIVVRVADGVGQLELERQLATLRGQLAREGTRGPLAFETIPLHEAWAHRHRHDVWRVFVLAHTVLAVAILWLMLCAPAAPAVTRPRARPRSGLSARVSLAYRIGSRLLPFAGLSAIAWACGGLALRYVGPLADLGIRPASLDVAATAYVAGLTAIVAVVAALTSPTRRTGRWRGITAGARVMQGAVACVLLGVGAVTAGRLMSLLNPALGFVARELYAVSFTPRDAREPDPVVALARAVDEVDRVGELPLALASSTPLADAHYLPEVRISSSGPWSVLRTVQVQVVSASYFTLLRIPTLAGRAIDARPGSPCAAVVNRRFASSIGGVERAVGQTVMVPDPERSSGVPCVIRGVVEDTRDVQVSLEAGPQLYLAARQHPGRARTVLVRARDQEAIAELLAKSLAVMNARLTIDTVASVWGAVEGATRLARIECWTVLLLSLLGCTMAVASVHPGVSGRAAAAPLERAHE